MAGESAANPQEAHLIIAGPPDWSTITEDIHCVLCDYNLRGLAESRCPECGYRFEWADLLDPRRRVHPYLFEHHPERSFWSFKKTLLGGLRPKRFWRTLHPIQPSRPRRLLLYWFLTVGPAILLTLFADLALQVAACHHDAWEQRRMFSNYVNHGMTAEQKKRPYGFPTSQMAIDHRTPIPTLLSSFRTAWRYLGWRLSPFGTPRSMILIRFSLVLFYPWLNLLGLLVFQISMRRARIRTVHVLRSIVYSYDVVFAWPLMAVVGAALTFLTNSRSSLELLGITLVPLLLVAVMLVLYKQYYALKCYLNFDKPLATLLASQFIGILLWANIAIPINLWT
jgi:hypothetical protein